MGRKDSGAGPAGLGLEVLPHPYKNGQVEEETFLYTSTYKAKPAKIQRNSAALPPSQELPQPDGGENLQEGQTEEAAAEGEVIMPFGS